MRFRLAALAALFPVTAFAGTHVGPTLGPQLPQPQQTYHALAPSSPAVWPRSGWGLRASVDGRWTDLRTPARLDWSADPQVPPSDVQAGVEWRHGAAAAVLGYGQYDEGADKDPELWDRTIADETTRRAPSDPGVLGLSFVFRSH